jgi:NAD(P)-dependent dehydrogenase (short-subunit alcohol dehydrogenase family)
MSNLNGKTVLVTGANRGIGAAVVRELLKAGVAKVYAAARKPSALPDFGDARVHPLQLDITDPASVKAAAAAASDVDVLVNNAGTATFSDLIDGPLDTVNADFNTNYFGTLNVVRAFVPVLSHRGSGTIANVSSVVGLTAAPFLAGYSASKAALHSLTQSLRATLRDKGITVLGIYPGPIDTDMARDLEFDKTSPESAAQVIVAGLTKGETYIFPDPTAQHIGTLWETDGRALDVALSTPAAELEAAQ